MVSAHFSPGRDNASVFSLYLLSFQLASLTFPNSSQGLYFYSIYRFGIRKSNYLFNVLISVKAFADLCSFDPSFRKISWKREWLPTPVFMPGEFPWIEEVGGLQSTGSQRFTHD